MTSLELQEEINRINALISDTQKQLYHAATTWARAERDYRKAKRTAWVSLRPQKLTVPEKEAEVDGITADERYARDQADADRGTFTESVRNLRSQLSAVTTLVALHRSEMELAR